MALGPPRIALVMAGGAARGAYEVGVVDYLLEDVAKELGFDVPLHILCGTSVGAINACLLAAFADEPKQRAARLVSRWTNLYVSDVVHPDVLEMWAMVRGFFGAKPRGARGGIVDPRGLARLIHTSIPFSRIRQHLRSGLVYAVTVSTTRVATGRTVVFVDCAAPKLPPWGNDPTISARPVDLHAEHALASAAIPFLFPAVKIGDDYYCDGGLRQNVPLSPARRLGADGLIVVNPRHIRAEEPPSVAPQAPASLPGPLFLLGKTLNALLLDRIDNDIDRVDRINTILAAGQRRYGHSFVTELNRELGYPPGRGMRPLLSVHIRASQDIGQLSAQYVRSPEFQRRTRGILARVMSKLADGDGRSEADLLSYLLFDGAFARQLIELGRADAKQRHAELCTFVHTLAGGGVRSAVE
jgi:NTE family protein